MNARDQRFYLTSPTSYREMIPDADVRKLARINSILFRPENAGRKVCLTLRRQSLYPTELYGPIVLKPAISRGLTPYIVFLGLDNILSEEGIIHGLLLSIYCRVRSHFSRRIELTTELLFFSRLVLALFLRRLALYPTELQTHIMRTNIKL